MSKKIIRHELVEITIPANSTQTRFQFPDIPNLRNSHIFGLQCYKTIEMPNSILSGNAVNANSLKAFITFVNYGGKEFLKQAPAQIFNTIIETGTDKLTEQDFKAFVGQKVSYPKSYVEFVTTPSTTVDTALVYSIYYSLPFAEEKRESGYSFGKQG